jgi:hypothetical protein
MNDDHKFVLILAIASVLITSIIFGSWTYNNTHRPPMEQCREACNVGNVKSFDPASGGCVCR